MESRRGTVRKNWENVPGCVVDSFEMDEPQFGETTEIRIKVVDKYKAEQ